MEIIIKGGPTHKPYKTGLENKHIDELYYKRKTLERDLKETIFNKDQMNWRDCCNKDQEVKRVKDYDKWKEKNEPKLREWSCINREFKKRGEEGRIHSPDDLRGRKKILYD